ncbi:hypothetical protein ERO13_A11G286600v2 [Gossypium hirsutum]|uniref:Transmembrane protein n=4 Tax=Gossypium TaxID=3633 RepID=A0ABR0N8E6_GOSAR|nr:uncharacterized protein LOC108472709 [Gossypium arboreum]XP_040936008.1 uncharacterized protein LOC121209431 [Gossypium hirsutum]KAG4177218.1 hypothetical protein ERO13_A11G286600v2 [Gossypium hirsutum]KAK5786829.1 hypothetical protein PVK06_041475 [Gossypium arboreum]PPR90021.1 hypothetical protein GOBAR_AA30669 [Gossypium barbadense]
MLQSLLSLSSPSPLSLPPFHNPSCSPLLQKSTFFSPLFPHSNVHLRPLLALPREEPVTTPIAEEKEQEEEVPIELPTSYSSFSSSSPLQTATTVLLSGAIAAFLFRSIRRRAKRAKEFRLRSKSLKEKSLNRLKAMGSASIKNKKLSTPSPVDALLGSLIAGVIAVFLYKFTTTIEAALNRQTVSDNFSVRQITITIRTIVNGLCYLATFVYGFNSLGLFLYSGQLALNPIMEGSMISENKNKDEENVGSVSSVKQNAIEGSELSSSRERED